jgi:hypothetical protein
MKVTTPLGRSLGIVAALVFLVAGCGNGHATASPVDYKKSPGVPTSVPTASKSAVKQAVRTECAAVRSVRRSARKLSRGPVVGHLAQFAVRGPGWAEQLATAAKPGGRVSFPARSRASTLSTSLGRMAVDLDLGNLEWHPTTRTTRPRLRRPYPLRAGDLPAGPEPSTYEVRR